MEIYYELWMPGIRRIELEPLFSFGGVYLWNRELVLEQAIRTESWLNYVLEKLPAGYVNESWTLFQVRALPGIISRKANRQTDLKQTNHQVTFSFCPPGKSWLSRVPG